MVITVAMQLTCPTCAAVYDVPDDAIGPNGRKIRCRACGSSWQEMPRAPVPAKPIAPLDPIPAPVPAPVADPEPEVEPRGRKGRGHWLLLALVVLVVALGVVAAILAWGPRQMASQLGLGGRVPLGIEITRQPDWRLIAGGSQLFAVSGRIWNPTSEIQTVPDIRAELKDAQNRTVYAWTITRPVPSLAPGRSATFDGAAVDVPPASAKINVAFVGTAGR